MAEWKTAHWGDDVKEGEDRYWTDSWWLEDEAGRGPSDGYVVLLTVDGRFVISPGGVDGVDDDGNYTQDYDIGPFATLEEAQAALIVMARINP